ncbi:ABC transporter ATP-binding protein [Jannaschia formosa]|uniref:ABC transporter ATP-binding protein n=1 Tax=Jannaschia formosa TaxID=2259592 RepID=UPI000E1B876D|nr:ABC transporter ATP-binding protein [Jannaschia formosa]TFL16682.1 ABC transporter ATP-binding protein [Jannaschia formosa]
MGLSVEIDGLSRGGTAVLGPISLTVGPGEAVALVGPSGIGKTSLLRAIAGLGAAPPGRIEASGRMAYVFQEPTLLPWRRVLDNVVLATGADRAAARRVLGQVGLGGRDDDWPGALSLGQQRRLSLARAFAAEPDLLLLDEPFVSLDARLADEMMGLVEAFRARSGAAMLMVTHATAEAERLADRIVTLAGRPATIERITRISRSARPTRNAPRLAVIDGSGGYGAAR